MTTHELLVESVKKLIEIESLDEWKNELLSKAPPILWFGNSKSIKKKILTIGANPSRWEFLDSKLIRSSKVNLQKEYYEKYYLSKNRFCHLNENQDYKDLIVNEELRNQVIKSYDDYFINEPYHWFGKNQADSYNVEGLLRGLNASYFEVDTKFRVCHIDIFPFATISDFKEIKNLSEKYLLKDKWAKGIVEKLLQSFDAKLILIFGRTNAEYFKKYFDIDLTFSENWESKSGKGNCSYCITSYNQTKLIAISVNLGNPVGFNKVGLQELGMYLNELNN